MKTTVMYWAIILLTCAVAITSHADDTEVYLPVTPARQAQKANILFIVDTSSSMLAEMITTEPYDSSRTYDGDCDPVYLYWRTTDQAVPSCSDSRRFRSDRFRCQSASDALAFGPGVATGMYVDRLARWDATAMLWRGLSTRDPAPAHVECRADDGIHGADTASSAVYITHGTSGPWTGERQMAADWPDTGSVYTVYRANYLNWYHFHSATASQSRLDVVKDVLRDTVNTTTGLRAGLMRFDDHLYPNPKFDTADGVPRDAQGGAVMFPVTDLANDDARARFLATVDALNAGGPTPLTETLSEALRYFRGDTVYFGALPDNQFHSVPASRRTGAPGLYQSPIINPCIPNHIVLLTDGQPTADDSADDFVRSLLTAGSSPRTCAHGPDYLSAPPDDSCLDELAAYLRHADHASAVTGNELPGTQNVIVHVVAFGSTDAGDVLRDTARRGGGRFLMARDRLQLAYALMQIVQDTTTVNYTFTEPLVPVSSGNRGTHGNDLFLPVFSPATHPHWAGNIKRYRFGFERDVDGNPLGPLTILDANGVSAVDPDSGLIRPDTTSLWTPPATGPDGADPARGGLASRMYNYVDGSPDADSRNVYTYTGGDGLLTRPENAFHEDNLHDPATGTGSIDPAWFNAGLDRNELVQLIRWGRGVDIDDEDDDGNETEGRIFMGASLHGRPLLIRYGPQDPDISTSMDILFTLDNDGYFHAARMDDTGDAIRQLGLFSFLPPQLLPNLKTLRANQPGTGDEASRSTIKYGLDGGLSAWLRDTADDGRIDPGVDRAYVYFNQRRGGDSIYALDVSAPASPRFLWQIVPGNAGFAELGSTWSRPVHARVTLQLPPDDGPRTRDVLIFGGGYDTRHDIPGLARSEGDSTGRAIYIVDAETGQRLWWAGPTGHPDNPDLPLTDMVFCIPSEITVVDSNGDEQADVLLVGDLGGRLWRFDISDGSISGGVIADLQGAGGASNNRRFFHAPDATVAPDVTGTASLLIAVGSGYQAHPLDTVTHERFYVIRDPHWPGPPRAPDGSITYKRVTEDDLLDLTGNPALDPDSLAAVDAARLEHGWYLSLRDAVSAEYLGEKILAPALIAGGSAMFTTYIPAPSAGACITGNGTGRVYAVDITQGSPSADLDGSGDGTPPGASDRFQELGGRGIPPGVTVVYPASDNTGPLVLVGPQITRIPLDNPPITTYWFEEWLDR